MSVRGFVLLLLSMGSSAGRVAFGQTSANPASVIVRLHVAAADGSAVEGVAFSVRDSAKAATATAVSDASGRAMVRLTTVSTELQYSARKIGWTGGDGRVSVSARDTIDIEVRLERTAQLLDTVRTIDTHERILSNNYDLGAAEIAASHRYITDAFDALRDLRPSMLGDRMRYCPYLQNLWVNGVRQPLGPWEPIVPFTSAGSGVRADGSGRRPLRAGGLPAHAPAGSPLALIKSEHIAELHYTSCWQSSAVGMHGENALFVILKPGVDFDLRHGSHVIDSAAARAAHVIP
jgi:hypothetical protein